MSMARAFRGFRFPAEVVPRAVRRYLRFPLGCRDLELMLADRGVTVDHVTLHRWASALHRSSRSGRAGISGRAAGRAWHVDETYLRVGVASDATCTG
jgi:IS6 family transposase